MQTALSILILLGTVSAHAILTPTADSLRRYQAIADSEDLYNVLGAVAPVKSITNTDGNNFTVLAGKCAISVKVEPVLSNPPQMVPPLKVTVGRSTCLPDQE
jgi:hypothetical protein